MLVKITSKRQVTFPARVLDALGVGLVTSLNWKKAPTGSRCVRGESTLPASRLCGAS